MMRGYFDGKDFRGGKYKALMPEFYPPEYREYIQQETELLKEKLKGANKVLEAGVGIGRVIAFLAPIVKEFIGIDNADFMLKQAKKVASTFSNVKIMKGNLEELENLFSQGYFDYSLCIWNTLGNVDDDQKVLQELASVTGKSIFVTTYLKGTLAKRKNWYRTLGINIREIDELNEIFYSESGLKSKSYNLADMKQLAEKSNLTIADFKVLAEVMLWIEFRKPILSNTVG